MIAFTERWRLSCSRVRGACLEDRRIPGSPAKDSNVSKSRSSLRQHRVVRSRTECKIVRGCTYNVDDDCCEDGSRDSLTILRILDAADELLVATAVETTDDAENDDAKGGDDRAVRLGTDGQFLLHARVLRPPCPCRTSIRRWLGEVWREDIPGPCLYSADEGLHDGCLCVISSGSLFAGDSGPCVVIAAMKRCWTAAVVDGRSDVW
jgi:hypothetical protein